MKSLARPSDKSGRESETGTAHTASKQTERAREKTMWRMTARLEAIWEWSETEGRRHAMTAENRAVIRSGQDWRSRPVCSLLYECRAKEFDGTSGVLLTGHDNQTDRPSSSIVVRWLGTTALRRWTSRPERIPFPSGFSRRVWCHYKRYSCSVRNHKLYFETDKPARVYINLASRTRRAQKKRLWFNFRFCYTSKRRLP